MIPCIVDNETFVSFVPPLLTGSWKDLPSRRVNHATCSPSPVDCLFRYGDYACSLVVISLETYRQTPNKVVLGQFDSTFVHVIDRYHSSLYQIQGQDNRERPFG
jgi:hypothetical protein